MSAAARSDGPAPIEITDLGQALPASSRAALWSRLPATTDLAWWADHAARSPDGRVLYVGAGVGRHAVPIARTCERVVAVEPDLEQVAVLRSRLEGRADLTVDVVATTLQDAKLSGQHGVVMLPGAVLNEPKQPGDRLAMLRAAAAAASRRGLVLIQVANPYWLAREATHDDHRMQPADGSPSIALRTVRKDSWPWAQRHFQRVVHAFAADDKVVEDRDLTALWPEDLRTMLRRAGLATIATWGHVPDVDDVTITGETWHLVCERTG